jgi:hypothetical protein
MRDSSAGIASHLRVLAAAWLALLLAVAPVHAQNAVLVPGRPPLTQEMVDQCILLYEYILDVQFTHEQRTEITDSFADTWRRQDLDGMEDIVSNLELYAELAARSDAEQAVLRELLQAEVLKQLRASPDDESAQWLLAVYDAGHRPIASGTPPLTRQMSDAYAEMLNFMVNEVAGLEQTAADHAFLDAFAQYMVESYPAMSTEQQGWLGNAPLYWAALQVGWPETPEAERAGYRAEWEDALLPVLAQLAAAATASAPAQPTPAPTAASGSGSGGKSAAQVAAEGWSRLESMRVMGNMMIDQLRVQANPYYIGNPYRSCC